MNEILVAVLILLGIFVLYTFNVGYPKHGWFKNIIHDKYHLHIPDFENQLDYDIKTKTVYTKCRYCNKAMIYAGICKHLVYENPNKIPDSMYDSYCRECISKNYTDNRRCCPLMCDNDGVCEMCKGCDIK